MTAVVCISLLHGVGSPRTVTEVLFETASGNLVKVVKDFPDQTLWEVRSWIASQVEAEKGWMYIFLADNYLEVSYYPRSLCLEP